MKWTAPTIVRALLWIIARQRKRFANETLAFLYWLVSGVIRYEADLDSLIGRYAPEWPVGKLAIVDRNVLRLSIFELSSPDADAPPKVVINEAVELAKTFGSDSSPTFCQWCPRHRASRDFPANRV